MAGGMSYGMNESQPYSYGINSHPSNHGSDNRSYGGNGKDVDDYAEESDSDSEEDDTALGYIYRSFGMDKPKSTTEQLKQQQQVAKDKLSTYDPLRSGII